MRDAVASAPGRVNLMGEHTDYNGGFVLPMPIPQRTTVTVRDGGGGEGDTTVRVHSRNIGGEILRYQLGEEARGGTWLDYVQGCTWALREAGYELGGCAIAIDSEVPLGSGLSSSASLEVATIRALSEAFALGIPTPTIALLAQRAENGLVGAPCGVMDPLACSAGVAGMALWIDTRSLATRLVALPTDAEVIVIASGVTHSVAGAGYRKRRAECEEAARRLGVESLRELEGTAAAALAAALPAPLDRRVRHVLGENQRVGQLTAAFERGDLAAVGPLFAASHASMRDDFEVSVPEIDALVELAAADRDILGARLTGGGFGGSIVALAWTGAAARAAARLVERYRQRVGLEARVLVAGRPS